MFRKSKIPKDKKPQDQGEIKSKVPKKEKVLIPPNRSKDKISRESQPESDRTKSSQRFASNAVSDSKTRPTPNSQGLSSPDTVSSNPPNKKKVNQRSKLPQNSKFRPVKRSDRNKVIPKSKTKSSKKISPSNRSDGVGNPKKVRDKHLIVKSPKKGKLIKPKNRGDTAQIKTVNDKIPPKQTISTSRKRAPATKDLNPNDSEQKLPKSKIPRDKVPRKVKDISSKKPRQKRPK